MAATPSEQAKTLRELADRIERGEHRLSEDLAARLEAEATRASRVDAAIDRVANDHAAILAQLAK